MTPDETAALQKEFPYLSNLDRIALGDSHGLHKAEAQYGGSWQQRGGIGAFMMLARKWDRIERQVGQAGKAGRYDIFGHIQADTRAEGLIDDIRDLRRYLMLIEAYMSEQGAESANADHRDNADHD